MGRRAASRSERLGGVAVQGMTVVQGVTVALATTVALGCGGGQQTPKEASDARTLEGLAVDDRSRCEFQGREDRDVRETSAPNSVVSNVRRVYGFVGTGEERRRVLLCREVDTNLDGVKDVVRTYTEDGEKLSEVADSDYDGRVDTWITFAAGRVHKAEFDRDGDGKADEVRHYVGGRLSRVQRDTNGDGRPDVFEVYSAGRLERIGVDVNHDGSVDRWDRDEARVREEEAREEETREKETERGGGDQRATSGSD
ncbi:MAG: hypothetical protein GX607_16610 [Myxococcales bacterium]|jgi:hypothetical protein|nr:hypothetical protein [Myxococcales bacterium]